MREAGQQNDRRRTFLVCRFLEDRRTKEQKLEKRLCSSVRIIFPKETCPYVLLSKSSPHKKNVLLSEPHSVWKQEHWSFILAFIHKSMSGSFPKSFLYSLSKLGVKIPFPIASWISVVLQKRPPSVSALGRISPS